MMSIRYILTIILVGTINISVTTADSFDTGFAVGVLSQKVLSKQSINKCRKKEVSKEMEPLMLCMDTELEENPITSIKNQHICYEKKYSPTITLSIVEKLIVIIVAGSFMFALISLCIFGTEDFNYMGGLIIGIIIADIVDSLLNDDEC